MPKKTIVLNIKDQSIEEFLEYLTQKLRGVDYSLTYKSGRVYLTIHGRAEEMEDFIRSARKAHGDFMRIHRPIGGIRMYPKDWLLEKGRGISISLLIRALTARGFVAKMRRDVLMSNVEPSELLDIFGQLRDIYWPIRSEIKQKKVREILTIASFITKEPVMSLLYQAMDEGIIRKTEEGIYLFTIDPELALDKLIGIKKQEEGS
ncbi:MAG TPA: DUF2067 domain-containing protein [Candidatus Korarchaeota archaeon]|nr:MAG: hypothetical protein DRO05_00950 [Candidatus Korarchaeota archaeon]HDD68893.1 DUF2067 domain-containing protein [Candidatus Korarchaeota archaeon]